MMSRNTNRIPSRLVGRVCESVDEIGCIYKTAGVVVDCRVEIAQRVRNGGVEETVLSHLSRRAG